MTGFGELDLIKQFKTRRGFEKEKRLRGVLFVPRIPSDSAGNSPIEVWGVEEAQRAETEKKKNGKERYENNRDVFRGSHTKRKGRPVKAIKWNGLGGEKKLLLGTTTVETLK